MTIRQQIKALLDHYGGDKMMLAIKIKCSTKTIERILNNPEYEVQAIRQERINQLYNRYCKENANAEQE